MAAPRVTIDALPEQTSAVGTDLLVVQNGTVTKKLTVDKLTTASNTAVTAHITDPSAAHLATAIGATPNTAPLTGTDVQTQLAQAAAAIDALGGGTTLTAEDVRDIVGAFVQAGANVTVVHDDPGNTLTIAASGGGGGITTEDAVDAVAVALTAGTGISVAYNDAANTLTITNTSPGIGITDGDKGSITVSGGGTVWTLDDDAVSNSKLADVAPLTLKGNNTASVAPVIDMTVAQVKLMLGIDNVNNTGDVMKPVSIPQQTALDLKADKAITLTTSAPLSGGGDLSANRTLAVSDFTTGARGTVPASGGGTTNFLRADGTWAAPPGGGGGINGITVSEAGSALDTDITTLDFQAGFDLTESPENEINISLDLSEYSGAALPLAGGGTGATSAGAALTALGAQPLDADLTTLASLTATTNNVIQSVGSAWASRTPTQVTATLDLATSSVKGLLPAWPGNTTTFLRGDGNYAAPPAPGTGTVTPAMLATADFGDFAVTGGVATVDNSAITLAKMADLAQDQFIGRTTASTGVPQTATITAAARTVLDDTTVAAMCTTLGAGPIRRTVKADTTTAYTPVLTDENQMVTLSNAGAITVSLPQDSAVAFPIGTEIDFLWLGAGQPTFTNGTGATVNGTPGLKLRAQYSAATAKKISTNGWVVIGDLAA